MADGNLDQWPGPDSESGAGIPTEARGTRGAALPILNRDHFHPPRCALHIRAAAPGVAEPLVLPDIGKEQKTRDKSGLEPAWLVICWDDPVNLMDYVTHVFQVVFGWQRQKAEYHMMQVHNNGKSMLARTTMEQAEHYVHQLQKYSLHATMERDS